MSASNCQLTWTWHLSISHTCGSVAHSVSLSTSHHTLNVSTQAVVSSSYPGCSPDWLTEWLSVIWCWEWSGEYRLTQVWSSLPPVHHSVLLLCVGVVMVVMVMSWWWWWWWVQIDLCHSLLYKYRTLHSGHGHWTKLHYSDLTIQLFRIFFFFGKS